MAESDAVKKGIASRSASFKSSKARTPTSKTNTRGTPAAPGIKNLLVGAPKAQKQVKKEEPKDFWTGLGETLDKPVIKQIIDGLSMPLYAVDNSLKNVQTRMQDASTKGQARGEIGIGNLGNTAQTAFEGLNPGSALEDIVKGVGQGLSGGFGGNKEDATTASDLIRSGQKFNNIDTESGESKAVQMGLGLGLDIAMDPLMFVGGGKQVAALKGAVRGSKQFKAETAISRKEGKPLSDTVEDSRWGNAKKQANVEITKYKDGKLDQAQAKETKKAIKKSDMGKIDFLIENISTLRPAVLRALVKTEDDITEVMNKIDAGDIPTAKLDELVQKMDPDIPDNPKAAVEAIKAEVEGTPAVGLSQSKPPTVDEKLFDVLGKLRTTNVTPRYSPDVVKNIREAMTVKETAVAAGKVPDVKATIKAIKDFDLEMRAVDPKTGKAGPGLSFPYKTADGKRYSLAAQDMIDSLDPTDSKFLETFEALDDFKVYKAPGTKKVGVTDEVLRTLGLRSEDIELVHQGVKIEDITDEIEVGDIMAIARDIKNGTVAEEALAPFYDMVGSTDRADIAKFIETNSKTDEFKKVATQLSRYGSHRTGATPLPHLGVSGHGLNALPSKGFTADDILAAKTPANPEQSIKFLEAKYSESALALAAQPNGAELRNLADEIFKSTIDTQRVPKGPLKTKRGASRDVANTGAKFETKYNTHSAMHRITLLNRELRAMPDLAKNKSKFDDAFMAVLKDVDDRLRLSGFDPHLSNMRMMGDKLTVRLAPSDVFGAMTKTQRTTYLHGNPMKSVTSREYLPSTVLDVAEVLVRSTTKLLPDGSVDLKSMVTQAVATLQGKHAQLGLGKREIQSNLDVNAAIKNDQEILRNLDKGPDKKQDLGFAKLHREAKTKVDKDAIVSLAIAKHPEEFVEIAKARMDGLPYDVVLAFTKGFGDKPTILSDLINTNMRNASVFGGSVAKQIGEASAEYTAKVLDALDNGTVGDFLSALALKPPFKVTDSTANVLLQANLKAVKASVADVDELAHAAAIGTGGGGTKANVKAYQADTDLMEQVAKAPAEMNTEIMFDLAIRERNRDMLWRMYGTSRYFNKRTGMPHTFDTLNQSGHASALLMTGFHGIIRGWRARGIQPEQLRVAMNALKNDLPGDSLSDELGSIMRNMFDPGKMNFLNRNSIGPAHFNTILKSVGFDEKKFFVNPAATAEEMTNAWKTWDIVHVEDFLSKTMQAMTKTAEDVSMGASFSSHFGSVTPGPGMVKIIDKSKDNAFFPLIDRDLFYPKEIAEEMVHIGRLMTESRSFKPGTKTHTFVTKVMDPVISTLKMTQTTMKPGHHVMSVIGDGWRNNLALTTIGVTSPARQVKLYAESYRVLRSAVGDITELSDFARFDRMQGLTAQLKVGSTQAGGFELFPNIGKGGKVNHADLYAVMQAKGVALPQHLGGMAEDFLTDYSHAIGGTGSKVINGIDKTTAGIDRLMNPLKPKFGMKHPYSVNKFTANRDTWSRGVMFLGAMRSRNFKSVDEATTYAADFVKKWAPTAIDLGGMETKYARRAIFYYTWLRGMVPRILEGAIAHPGVAMIPNKAMYNLAQANGLDLNSIGDPFPDDQLFPSWYTQKVLGPQWQAGGDLWGFNPTGPLGDVMNSLGSNISPKDFTTPDAYTKTAGTFLNMSTPWFKAPLELIQGKSLVSGAPIEDKGQYLQDMIGPLRTASRVSGKEMFLAPGPDGLAMPNRTEKKFRNGMTDEQTLENALPELLNWASGMQFTNYTSDSAENSAYYQDKEKFQKEFKDQERF